MCASSLKYCEEKREMYFPKEIIEEILIRLPLLKTIIMFKCVSKDWNDVVSSNEFRRRYQFLRRKDVLPAGFFYHHKNPHFSDRNPCMPVRGQAKFINTSNVGKNYSGLCHNMQQIGYIIGCSEGLVLLSRNPMSYHVFDPLTKKHVQLPKTLKKYSFVCTGFICKKLEQIGHNNMNSTSSHITYKVVRVGIPTPAEENTSYKVETYSSETRKWHKSMMTISVEFCLIPQSTAKVIGGVFHWRHSWGCRAIAYDPEDSVGHATIIEYPQSGWSTILTGTEDGRLLSISEYFAGIDVWGLGRQYEGKSYLDEDIIKRSEWTMSYTINFIELGLRVIDFGPNEQTYMGHTIDIHPQNSNILFFESDNEVLSYNLNDKSIETRSLKTDEEVPFMDPYVYTYYYVEWPSWPCLS